MNPDQMNPDQMPPPPEGLAALFDEVLVGSKFLVRVDLDGSARFDSPTRPRIAAPGCVFWATAARGAVVADVEPDPVSRAREIGALEIEVGS